MLLALMIGHVCLPWWVSQRGGARDLALYSVVNAALSLAAMPLLSPLGDRHSKRQLIVWALRAFAVSAAGMALFAGSGRYHLGAVIAIEAVAVCAMALLLPATHSLVVDLVPAAQVTRALGLQQSAQSSGRLIGPAIGGAMLAATGTAATLWLYCALLLAAAVLAQRLPSHTAPTAPTARGARGAWWTELRQGLRANWSVPIERGWILVNFLSWIFLFPALTMLVPLKVQSLGLSAAWLGWCEAALSLGMLAGSLGAAEWVIARGGRYATRIAAAVLQGLAMGVAGLTPHRGVLVAAFAVVGFMNACMVLVGMTHRMLARPAAFRARMVAGAMATTQVASALGPALAGAALVHWRVDAVFAAFGVAGGLLSLGLMLVPGFRHFMALDHQAAEGWYAKACPQAFPSLQADWPQAAE